MPQYWVRYLYPFLGAGFIVVAYAISLFNIPRKAIKVAVFICLVASAFELSGHLELISSIVLSCIIFLLLKRILRIKHWVRYALALFIITSLVLIPLNNNYNRYEFNRYLDNAPYPKEDKFAWKWLNDNTLNSRIAYAGVPLIMPLYGTNFKNDVLYVSVNNVHPINLHYFPNAKFIWVKDYIAFQKSLENIDNYRQNPNYAIWLKNLLAEKIDFLVIYSFHEIQAREIFPLEDTWAKNHPEVFNLAFVNPKVHIYKLLK
jgi:hypothetical protein